MNTSSPIRFLSYTFPILQVRNATFSTVCNVQKRTDVEKVLSELAQGLDGDISPFQEGWIKARIEDVAEEFVVRGKKLEGLKAVVLALLQLLDLPDGCLSTGCEACMALDRELGEACDLWNEAETELMRFYDGTTKVEAAAPSTPTHPLHELQTSDGTTEVSMLQRPPPLPQRPKTHLVGIPPLSTVLRTQSELAKWQTLSEKAPKDVEYLVALCNRAAPAGNKSWEQLDTGEDPSQAQLYAQNYTSKKQAAISLITGALEKALEGERFPPESTVIAEARDAFENWNALSKEVQTMIDKEINKLVDDTVSESFSFLTLSPENFMASHISGSPQESEWLSNDHRHQLPFTEGLGPLQRPSGFSRSVSCHPRHWGYEDDDPEELKRAAECDEPSGEVAV